MSQRDTRTGSVLEQMVLPALNRGGYRYHTQVDIGRRPGGGKHKIDVLAESPGGGLYPISLKWQQVSGTAEQKVPYEVICLAEAIMSGEGKYTKAYLVLGGDGWSLRDFFIKEGLTRHLKNTDLVSILSLESFVALANTGRL